MSGQYDPRSAVLALRDTIARHSPQIKSSNVPGLVNEQGRSLSKPERPPVEGLCILVSVLSQNDPARLPSDFAAVLPTREGLKAHVRPDGGVFLGFYGDSPENATVVYGDPLMSTAQTKRVVLDFWKHERVGAFAPKIITDLSTSDEAS